MGRPQEWRLHGHGGICQEGEGIGSFFGNLLKKVLPLATKAIKGAAHIAAPHLKEAATELAGEASKSLIRTINNKKERQYDKIIHELK